MSQSHPFSRVDFRTPEQIEVLRRWHAALAHNRGDRAALRRVQDAREMFAIEAFARLMRYWSLSVRSWDGPEREDDPDLVLARVAAAVAEIEAGGADESAGDDEDGDARPEEGRRFDPVRQTLGGALSVRGANGKEAAVSPARLRLLAGTDDPDLFLRLLRGLLTLVKGAAPVADTARIVARWYHPTWRDEARRRLLRHYFANVSSSALESRNA